MPIAASALPAIAFSKNPIPVILTSTDYIAIAGVAAVYQLIFKLPVPSGHQIPLVWASASVILEADVSPDDSGDQFLPGAGDAAYVNALIPVLEQNYYINRDFTLSYALIGGFPAIIMTAINTGVLYNINEVIDTTVAVTMAIAGINEELQPNMAQHLEVWVKKSGVDIKAFDNNLQLDFPITGITTKDIAEILNPYVDPAIPENSDKPNPAAITWQPCPNSLISYYIKYGEYYGDTPQVRKIAQSAPAFVNVGGLAVQAALGQTLANYLHPGIDNSKALCLRQGSKVKMIQPDQPEFLYWINLSGADIDIKVSINMFFTDGTGPSSFTTGATTAVSLQKYYISVGYNAQNINANLPAGKQCRYYTVRVVSSTGSFMSQLYTYVIDNFREFPRYFIFLNSLGGYQTIYTWGKGQNATDRTKTDVQKQVPYATAAISGGFLETNIRLQDKTIVNTGYTFRRDITLLKDFLNSTEKYYYYKGSLVPIGINTQTLTEALDGDNLNVAQIEFYPLYTEVVFTDDATAPDDMINIVGSAGAPGGFNTIADNGDNANNDFYTDL